MPFCRFWFVVCAVVLAMPAQAQTTPPSQHDNNLETFQALHNKQVSLDYFETRFEDILVKLQEETDLVFVLDESASDNSLDDESLVTRSLPEMRLSTALKFILDEYSCTWSIRDGVVVITSKDASLDIANFGLVAFNCDDLIKKIEPRVKIFRAFSGGFGDGGAGIPPVVGSGGGGVFAVPVKMLQEETPTEGSNVEATESEEEPKEQTQPETPITWEETLSGRDQLIETIVSMIDPDSWESNGGNGRITALNNVILINQTQENLGAVSELLEQLRSVDLQMEDPS